MATYHLKTKSQQAYKFDFTTKKWIEFPLSGFNRLTNLINRILLQNDNVREWIKFTYKTSPDQFAAEIAKYGVIMDGVLDTEIDDLERIHNSGAVNILNVMKNIKKSQADMDKVNFYSVSKD